MGLFMPSPPFKQFYHQHSYNQHSCNQYSYNQHL